MLERSTYYILDAKGQQLSMYEHEVDTAEVKYYLKERNVYGSSRFGIIHDTINMYNPQLLPGYGVLGNRNYELTDHRNNVYAVVNDHIAPLDENNDDEVDGYQVGIVNVSDFSPFNVQLDGRTIKNGPYRYSVQGQESHDEIHGEGNYINYKYRGYDPRLGRLDWMIDPLAPEYPHNSPYAFSENVVIHAIELEGLEKVIKHLYNYETKTFSITDKYIDKDLRENVNLYVYQNPDGKITRQVYKGWTSGKSYVAPVGQVDYYGLMNTFGIGSGYVNAVEMSHAEAKTEPWYKTGIFGDWEGNHDGAGLGGWGGSKDREIKGGTGALSVILAPFTIAGGGVWIAVGSVGLFNGADDMVGAIQNSNSESLTQSLINDPHYKDVVGKVKTGATFITAIAGGAQLWKMGVDAPTLVGVANDVQSLMRDVSDRLSENKSNK